MHSHRRFLWTPAAVECNMGLMVGHSNAVAWGIQGFQCGLDVMPNRSNSKHNSYNWMTAYLKVPLSVDVICNWRTQLIRNNRIFEHNPALCQVFLWISLNGFCRLRRFIGANDTRVFSCNSFESVYALWILIYVARCFESRLMANTTIIITIFIWMKSIWPTSEWMIYWYCAPSALRPLLQKEWCFILLNAILFVLNYATDGRANRSFVIDTKWGSINRFEML